MHGLADVGSVSHLPRTDFQLFHWGHSLVGQAGAPGMIVLSRVRRDADGAVSSARIADHLAADPALLCQLLPPFGAVLAHRDRVTLATDFLGFQQAFYANHQFGLRPSLSTSSLVLGNATAARIDDMGVAVQSFLGWQLGQRTLFAGIEKLPPGATALLGEPGVRIDVPRRMYRQQINLRQAVSDAAALLRHSLNALLDEHPDAVLQLTGGMDSRLLLSAIPVGRRRGLRAMTLRVPGSRDTEIAGSIAQRYGIEHEVHGLADLRDLSAAESWDLCFADAVNLDAMSDPLALAAQRLAEMRFEQGVRISGLGGEIARGFYYHGRVRDRTYTRADAERLASWRMFANEAVEPDLLTREFREWAHEVANKEVYHALLEGGSEWFRATDHLYLHHRMQRWAGLTDGAVSAARIVVNPMLDPRFLDIAARLAPEDKSASKFLAALQIELDSELGALPLDGRPPPRAYVNPRGWYSARTTFERGKRIIRKVSQRLSKANRPPAGGTIMSRNVVRHWISTPGILEQLVPLGFIRDDWLDAVISGQVEPRPSSVAFLTNLIALQSFRAGTGSTRLTCRD